MKASIYDVARYCGLSVVTVSRVLNNTGNVREKNRRKVLDAIEALDYRPHAAAQSLARGHTRIIGLIMTALHDRFFELVVNEINRTLARHGYFLALSVSNDVRSRESHDLMHEDRVDGLILLSLPEEDRYVAQLKKRSIPFVLIDNQRRDHMVPSVLTDNYYGGYEAAKHLLSLGHTSIAHVCGPEYFLSTRERKRGFLDALREARLSPFAVVQGDYEIGFGYETAKSWIRSGKLPTAVFAGDDYIAVGIVNALAEEGMRVPEAMSVIGYDDQYIASRLRPYLTTVRQPAESIGQSSVELLLKWIGAGSTASVTVEWKPELVIRESTAALKA